MIVRKLKHNEKYLVSTSYGTIEEEICSINDDIWIDVNNFLHNEDNNPAKIIYHSNKNVDYKTYRKNGKHHNLYGPSTVTYYPDGTICNVWYDIEGKEFKKEDWEIEVNRIFMLDEI